jgi:16S rRNA (guanine527-N7)-methyltransferase
VKHPGAAFDAYCRAVLAEPSSVTALRDAAAIRRELVDASLVAAPLLGESLPSLVIDVGSGNGSPGLPLALWYGAPVTLLESVERKAAFLRRLVAELAPACGVIHDRSEHLAAAAGRDAYDLVLARALAPPSVAAELCLPLARPGGRVVLWTGQPPLPEVAQVAGLLGGELGRVEGVGGDRHLVELRKLAATPERFPRRPGVARKRPLASLPSTS